MTTTFHHVNQKVSTLGYVPFIPKREDPNYYELSDKTILRIHTILNSLSISTARVSDVNVHNVVTAYVPQALRSAPPQAPPSFEDMVKHTDVEDMKYTTIDEHFNEYDLEDGKILKLKTVLSQVNRTKLVNMQGERVYTINSLLVPELQVRHEAMASV